MALALYKEVTSAADRKDRRNGRARNGKDTEKRRLRILQFGKNASDSERAVSKLERRNRCQSSGGANEANEDMSLVERPPSYSIEEGCSTDKSALPWIFELLDQVTRRVKFRDYIVSWNDDYLRYKSNGINEVVHHAVSQSP